LDIVDGDRCYAGLGALPEKPGGAVLVVQPQATLQVFEDMARLGIQNAWSQQGADSPDGEAKAEELGIHLISGECLLMFLQPVHPFISGTVLFGQYSGKCQNSLK
jgi:predicted CoA-binding protein